MAECKIRQESQELDEEVRKANLAGLRAERAERKTLKEAQKAAREGFALCNSGKESIILLGMPLNTEIIRST